MYESLTIIILLLALCLACAIFQLVWVAATRWVDTAEHRAAKRMLKHATREAYRPFRR